MIIFSDKTQQGSNALYPMLLPGKHSILLGYDFSAYFRRAPFYLLASSIIAILLSLALPTMQTARGVMCYGAAVGLQAALVAVKIYQRRGQKLRFTVGKDTPAARPAPLLAWIEQLAMSANFVLIGRIGYTIATVESARFGAFCLILFYLPMSFLPLINYIAWKTKR